MREQLHFPGIPPAERSPWVSLGLDEEGAAMTLRRSYDWAKVYVDMMRHPKLVWRPDCDRLLWLGLILHCQEYAPSTAIIRDLSPSDLKNLFNIKAPLKMVKDALDYFVSCGIVQHVTEGLFVTDFIERQAPDSQAVRQQRKRDKERNGPVTNRDVRVTRSVTTAVTEPLPEGRRDKLEDGDSRQDGESERKESTVVDNYPPAKPDSLSNSLNPPPVNNADPEGEGETSIAALVQAAHEKARAKAEAQREA